MDGFDAALARYRAFLASEPIAPLLRRSLALLVPDNIRIDTVTPDDSLRCTTDGTSVTVGGAAYLLRADFDARHWMAALRVLLARELQHDGSSDRDVCAAVRVFSGAYFHEHYALAPELGALLGQRILNILEQARTDNILCRRFPGYLPLLRFVCYAQLDAAAPGSALEALLDELEAFALTGIPCRTPALQSVCAQVEAAILAPSASACAQHCRQTLTTLAPELARLCREADDDARARIASQCVDYAFSEAERAEALGDGCDSSLRLHSEAQDAARSGPSADGEDAELDKGDSAGGGSGDNSERYGDMSGSLASQEVKSSGSAGTNGREDRGRSSSVGRQRKPRAERSKCHHVRRRVRRTEGRLRRAGEPARGAWHGLERAPRLCAQRGRAGRHALKRRTGAHTRERDRAAAERCRAARRAPGRRRAAGACRALHRSDLHRDVYHAVRAVGCRRRFPSVPRRCITGLTSSCVSSCERSAGQRTGALSQRELWKVPLDAKDVFRRKAPPSQRETAFYLLIDRSGSMGSGVGGRAVQALHGAGNGRDHGGGAQGHRLYEDRRL